MPEVTPATLAVEERRAAKTIWLGNYGYVLAGAVLAYWVALFLPFIPGVAGWEIVLLSDAATAANVKLTEYVFVWLGFIGIGVLSAATVLLRKTSVALASWIVATIALFTSLFAVWLRLTRPGVEAAMGVHVGFILMIIIAVIVVFIYSMVALRRSPAQQRLAEARATTLVVDPVESVQAEATAAHQDRTVDVDQGNRDDRRARAAERHRRLEEEAGGQT